MSATKRIFDVLFALAGVVLSSPMWLAIAVAIKLDSPGSVLFRHRRAGTGGKPFLLYKFRTMVPNAEGMGPNITGRDDPRITRVGKWLRKWKLDETPQFLNILKGEMSVVGPRPETPDYVAMYDMQQRKVLSVRPGLTGLASLAFRNEEALLAGAEYPREEYIRSIMPQKLSLDLAYIGKCSLLGDLIIIGRTFMTVLLN